MIAVWWPHEFRLRISLGAEVGIQINSGREDCACGPAVLPALRVGLEIELSDFKAENAMLIGDCL